MSMRIKPIFNKDGNDYAFQGCQPGLPKGANTDFRYIVNTLRDHLGDDLDFTEENGTFIIPYAVEDLSIVRKIYSDTHEFPIKIGRSHLWFEILEISNEIVETYEY